MGCGRNAERTCLTCAVTCCEPSPACCTCEFWHHVPHKPVPLLIRSFNLQMDHKNENFNMFDLIAYRIKFVEHPHAGGW